MHFLQSDPFNFNQGNLNQKKSHLFSSSIFCVILLISIKSFSTRRITFAVEHYVDIRQSQITHVAPKLCPFLEHLKMTTCAKIVPVVVLLASS